jgi:hypothetical protein
MTRPDAHQLKTGDSKGLEPKKTGKYFALSEKDSIFVAAKAKGV